MTTFDNCPNCSASLIGEQIPEYPHLDDCDQQRARSVTMGLGDRCYCLPFGDATHFRREIGHEVRGVYDGVLFWSCPDCGQAWPRWNDGGPRSATAAKYVAEHNEAIKALGAVS